MVDVLDAMNVHYISGVSLSTSFDSTSNTWTATASDAGSDLSVYDGMFDNVQFDVAHDPRYSPAFENYYNSGY